MEEKKSLWKKTTAEKQYRYSEKIRLTERDRTLRQFFITVKYLFFTSFFRICVISIDISSGKRRSRGRSVYSLVYAMP